MDESSTRATIRTNGFGATTLLVVAVAMSASATHAQQVLEIDTAVGRVIIDDEWRAIRTIGDMPLDRTRAILYANDDEEPEAVMAFSLETGEWIRTIPTPEGDGPFELSRGTSGMTVGRDGTLHVSGYVRVLEFDPLGNAVSNWRPPAQMVMDVCDFNGQPAIPAYGGVIRRGPDGEDESVGPGVVDGYAIVGSTSQESLWATGIDMSREGSQSSSVTPPRIACTDDAAYVVTSYAEGPDSVSVYHRNGEAERLAVPTEFTEAREDCTVELTLPGVGTVPWRCTTWNRSLQPTLDGRGNLVLLGRDLEVPGTVIDPATGCYALIRKPEPTFYSDALHIYQDSALVFRYDSWQQAENSFSVTTAANRVSLHPLRRVSGEPCPGMLPSVEGVR